MLFNQWLYFISNAPFWADVGFLAGCQKTKI
jgi:hypothetical protein